jgi:hypothetical protein
MRVTPLSVALLAFTGLVALAAPAGGQTERAKVTVTSEARDTILAALRIEAEAAGLTFVQADKNKALFTKDAGHMPVRGRMMPIILEVTFHFEKAKPGTRVIPTEELVARQGGAFEERRRPKPRDRAHAYQQLLDRTKARLESPKTRAADSIPTGL